MEPREIRAMLQYPDAPLVDFAVRRANLTAPEWECIRLREREDSGGNSGGFFGNEGLWAVIILAIIFGWGWGGNRNGQGGDGMSAMPYIMSAGGLGGNAEFYADMAHAWLDDKDAVEDKAAAYYCYVVQH